jgi:hypothetical protein
LVQRIAHPVLARWGNRLIDKRVARHEDEWLLQVFPAGEHAQAEAGTRAFVWVDFSEQEPAVGIRNADELLQQVPFVTQRNNELRIWRKSLDQVTHRRTISDTNQGLVKVPRQIS